MGAVLWRVSQVLMLERSYVWPSSTVITGLRREAREGDVSIDNRLDYEFE